LRARPITYPLASTACDPPPHLLAAGLRPARGLILGTTGNHVGGSIHPLRMAGTIGGPRENRRCHRSRLADHRHHRRVAATLLRIEQRHVRTLRHDRHHTRGGTAQLRWSQPEDPLRAATAVEVVNDPSTPRWCGARLPPCPAPFSLPLRCCRSGLT